MKITVIKTIDKKIIIGFKCDVCKEEYSQITREDFSIEENRKFMNIDLEIQEFSRINFTGGYGSIFGDGYKFELDICQHCLKEKLGEYIRCIDDGFTPDENRE